MPSFADFLTPAGTIVAAGVVTSLIEVLKASIPTLDDKLSGAFQAFFFTAVLYALTAWAVGTTTADAGLNVFMAWLTCATAAIGLKAVATHVSDVRSAHDDYYPPADPVAPDPAAPAAPVDPVAPSDSPTGDS